MVPWLSQLKEIGCGVPGVISSSRRLSQMPSFVASQAAMNSDSVVERATQDLRRLLQATGPPLSRKINPVVERRDPESPA